MLRYKCKKSVFCILFLFFFFIGTICGVLLFQLQYHVQHTWIVSYGKGLLPERSFDLWRLFFVSLRPLLLAFLLGSLSFGWRLIPLLIVGRGCLISYLFSLASLCETPVSALFLRELLLLSSFYFLVRWAYYHFDMRKSYDSDRRIVSGFPDQCQTRI